MLTGKIKNIFLKSSVATISTALFKRGLRNQFIQGVSPLNPNLSNMVGYAFTVRYIPAREDLNTLDVFNSPDLTVLYCVNGEGEIVIEYPENIYKEKFITLDTEPRKIIIFNSGLKYYFLNNNFKDVRTTLCYKAKLLYH